MYIKENGIYILNTVEKEQEHSSEILTSSKTKRALRYASIHTIKDIDAAPVVLLEALFGKRGVYMHNFATVASLLGKQIEDVVLLALERGINDWAVLNNTKAEWKKKPDDMPDYQYATQLLIRKEKIRV